MNSLKHFVLILGACFIVPTYCMVAQPYAAERNRQTVPYEMANLEKPTGLAPDPEELKGLRYPMAFAGDRKRGEQIYGREGCAQCHTQVIRPDYAGIDQWKKTWGSDQSGVKYARQTLMWDYMHEDFAMLGQRRIGPDLANAGYRFQGNPPEGADAAVVRAESLKGLNDFYLYLYAPRARKEWSNSPGYKHLFITRLKEGKGSEIALQLPPNLAPAEGMEIVPSSEARALAEYVLGLKRDQPVPSSITGKKPTPESK